mmetsp:Transcript_10275/g.28886  ORF Transcript_10275/g.28886 Transcript_10275/m.28886 type:complete len:227 (-) Transcript_10275:156-836(-)
MSHHRLMTEATKRPRAKVTIMLKLNMAPRYPVPTISTTAMRVLSAIHRPVASQKNTHSTRSRLCRCSPGLPSTEACSWRKVRGMEPPAWISLASYLSRRSGCVCQVMPAKSRSTLAGWMSGYTGPRSEGQAPPEPYCSSPPKDACRLTWGDAAGDPAHLSASRSTRIDGVSLSWPSSSAARGPRSAALGAGKGGSSFTGGGGVLVRLRMGRAVNPRSLGTRRSMGS